MNEKDKLQHLAGINSEATTKQPEFEMNPVKGKTYLAASEPYEGDIYYEVPNGTKMKDFMKGGKFYEWITTNRHQVPEFIFKCIG